MDEQAGWRNERRSARSHWAAPGRDVDFTRPFTGGPTAVGFDHYFGIAASLNMSPFCFLQDDRVLQLPLLPQETVRDANFMAVDEGVRSPDFTIHGVLPRLAGEAMSFIENHASRSPKRPFFLYAPLTSPHLPVVVNAEYRGRSQAVRMAISSWKQTRFWERFSTRSTAPAWQATRWSCSRPTMAASTTTGKPGRPTTSNITGSAAAAHIREFGHQGNAHLRGTKADIWEGGHRVPFIVRWPGRTPVGTHSGELIELTDLLATAAAIVGAKLPPGDGPDSRNILPALLNARPDRPVREYAVHHSYTGVFAIRQGPWKLIPARGSGGFTQPRTLDPAKDGGPAGQLYHLESDPSETRNVYAEHPDVVERLGELLKAIQGDDV